MTYNFGIASAVFGDVGGKRRVVMETVVTFLAIRYRRNKFGWGTTNLRCM